MGISCGQLEQLTKESELLIKVMRKEPAVIVLCFEYSALRRNAQPSPQVAIFGVWGDITNKHYRGFSGDGKSSVIGKLT